MSRGLANFHKIYRVPQYFYTERGFVLLWKPVNAAFDFFKTKGIHNLTLLVLYARMEGKSAARSGKVSAAASRARGMREERL